MNNRCTQARASERIWTRVMRQGISVEAAATEFGLTAQRLERVLMAVGKRRVAREVYQEQPGTRRSRR